MPTLLQEPPLRPTHEIFHVERILDPDDVPAKREHRVIAVLPAYNAERTLAATLADFPAGCVDEILLVDDGSTDNTVRVAGEMGLTVLVHPENRGYGGNQKTCYKYALEHGADVVVMIHPDYQYAARGRADRTGHLRRGPRQPHPVPPGGPQVRDAVVEVLLQPGADVRGERGP